MPCQSQSQSVKSVSIVHTTGRSISHDSSVSLSINLSVSVGACTKNNTRPRALTSAVRYTDPLTSYLSLLYPPFLSLVGRTVPGRGGKATPDSDRGANANAWTHELTCALYGVSQTIAANFYLKLISDKSDTRYLNNGSMDESSVMKEI